MIGDINKWKKKPFDDGDYKMGLEIETWVNKKAVEDWTCFMYECEPSKYAGNAYPWVIYAETNR